jgi:hypothetical protein
VSDRNEIVEIVRLLSRFKAELITLETPSSLDKDAVYAKWADKHKSHLQAMVKVLTDVLSASRNEAPDAAKPIVWLGSKREWGDMIVGAQDAGLIDATGPLNALEQASKHFLWKERDKPLKPAQPFRPRSVWQNLKNRDDYQDPKKPGPR